MKQRSTRQLAVTYEVLAASADHPTAEQVAERVRRHLPRVSLGTIYRNLDKLREQGRLRVLQVASSRAHFDALLEPHDHFVCESCARVLDLEGAMGRPDMARLRREGMVVCWQTTVVSGLCRACTLWVRRAPAGHVARVTLPAAERDDAA